MMRTGNFGINRVGDHRQFLQAVRRGVTSNGLVKKAELNVYVTKDEFGDLVSGVTIKADQIKLEGLVTANSYFKVLTDGSIETRNANISGTVKADKGKIGGFTIDSGRLYWKSRDYFGNDSRSLNRESHKLILTASWMWRLMRLRKDGLVLKQ